MIFVVSSLFRSATMRPHDGAQALVVDGMRREMHQVQNDPNAVFFYAFVQARAVVY